MVHRLRATPMEPPVTLAHLHARHRWIMPLTAAVFLLLAVGAANEWLPSDHRLVAGRGPSFPSGHPMAAAARIMHHTNSRTPIKEHP